MSRRKYTATVTSVFNTDGGIHRVPLPGVTGHLWLCGKHHIGPDVNAVRDRHGIDTVVCLVKRHELEDRYDDYLAWLDSATPRTALWRPIDDLTYPALNDVIDFLDELTARVRAGQSLVVHCAAGIGRAGTTAVAMAMMLGMGADEALTHVRSHRPSAGPEAGSQAAFIGELRSFLTQ